MKIISVQEAYSKAKELFGDRGPRLLFAPPNQNETLMSSVLDERQDFSASGNAHHISEILFMGDVINFGEESKKLVEQAMRRGIKSLRGRQESIVVSILDAAEEGKAEKVAALTTVWSRWMGASDMLQSFLSDRTMENVSNGLFASHSQMLHLAGSGEVDLKKFAACLRDIIGENVISWIRAMPAALIVPSFQDSTKCDCIFVITHGSLDPDMTRDIRMITDENAVWSEHEGIGVVTSGEALYSVFGDSVNLLCIKMTKPAIYDAKTGAYSQVTGYHAVPPGSSSVRVVLMGRKAFTAGAVAAEFVMDKFMSKRFPMLTKGSLLKEIKE